VKKLIFLVIFYIAFAGCTNSTAGSESSEADCIWVEPYYRTDGTCVRGHWKSAPGKECTLVGSKYEDC
jgi:hypothetical protein